MALFLQVAHDTYQKVDCLSHSEGEQIASKEHLAVFNSQWQWVLGDRRKT